MTAASLKGSRRARRTVLPPSTVPIGTAERFLLFFLGGGCRLLAPSVSRHSDEYVVEAHGEPLVEAAGDLGEAGEEGESGNVGEAGQENDAPLGVAGPLQLLV